MDIESVREFCINLKGTTESFPFDQTTLVFKVMNKMYCLESLEQQRINLKGEPEELVELVEHYPAVSPGYHMNKKHWITVDLNQLNDDELLQSWIRKSYDLVVNKLTKKDRENLKRL